MVQKWGEVQGRRLCPAAPVQLEHQRSSRAGLELKGLGFIVPVLLPGTACLSVPSLLLRGRMGGVPEGGTEGDCVAGEP